ncbi:hypothetical protein CJ030_MR7G014391 [Morella rubra]|uniref:Uncharacterized protein n=1 Tax=Morella rubra TaxID=262757 RepID=A0A6A1V1U7_9ROSI|nr:hypothetical protein CJ030_MR7G014381 [Morella rubra]KAB1206246.1 hypothetical protein CJ030_MR7G014391 [Morella rubra]
MYRNRLHAAFTDIVLNMVLVFLSSLHDLRIREALGVFARPSLASAPLHRARATWLSSAGTDLRNAVSPVSVWPLSQSTRWPANPSECLVRPLELPKVLKPL